MIESTRRLLAIASICTAAAVLLTAPTATAAAIPPPEGGIQLPPAETPNVVLVGDLSDDNASTSPDQPTRPSPQSSPRIVQVEKSWIETWAVGGRRPLPQSGPPRATGLTCEEQQDPGKHKSKCDGERPECSPPKNTCSDDTDCHQPTPPAREHRERRKSRQCDEQWPEIRMILKSYNDLIEFHEAQGHQEQAEEALRERIDVCSKLAELRMLAEFDGPGAAMQEYYRYVDRPDRALELDLHNIDREITDLEREKTDVEAEITRLSGRYDLLERRIDDLRERLDQRTAELNALQENLEALEGDDADSDDDAPAAPEKDAAPRKRLMKETALTALPGISLQLVTLFLL